MKFKSLIVILSITLASGGVGAQQVDETPLPREGSTREVTPSRGVPYNGPGCSGADHDYCGASTNAHSSCSPEVKTKNAQILETTLSTLLKTKDFSEAPVLKRAVRDIRSDRVLDRRIHDYCALLGVDAEDPAQIAAFVGARDLAPYVNVARRRLKLSDHQARVLVEALSEKLLSSLND